MPFRNPILGAASEIYGLDYFAWPCITGEQSPPTLSNASYSAIGGRPSVRCSNTGPGTATWTYLPWVGPRYLTQTTVEMSLWFYRDLPVSSPTGDAFEWEPNLSVSVSSTGLFLSDATYGGGPPLDAAVNTGSNDNRWRYLFASVAANGDVTVRLDGVLLWSYNRGVAPGFGAPALRPRATGASLASHGWHISNLRYRWLTN